MENKSRTNGEPTPGCRVRRLFAFYLVWTPDRAINSSVKHPGRTLLAICFAVAMTPAHAFTIMGAGAQPCGTLDSCASTSRFFSCNDSRAVGGWISDAKVYGFITDRDPLRGTDWNGVMLWIICYCAENPAGGPAMRLTPAS